MTATLPAPEFSRHSDQDALVEAARARFVDVVAEAQGADGLARIAVTGGGAGIGLLAALAADSGDVDWSRVMVFFGDERFVPEESPDRNVGQAREALFDHVDIPESYIFPIAPSGGAYLEDPVCAADAHRPRVPGRANSLDSSTAPPHSPPTPTPWRKRIATSRMGAQMPTAP